MDRLYETEKEGKTAVAVEETPTEAQNLQEAQISPQNTKQNLQFSGTFENNISVSGIFSVTEKSGQSRQTNVADVENEKVSTIEKESEKPIKENKIESEQQEGQNIQPQDATQRALNAQNLDPNMTIADAVKANSYANSFGEKTIADYLREKQQNLQKNEDFNAFEQKNKEETKKQIETKEQIEIKKQYELSNNHDGTKNQITINQATAFSENEVFESDNLQQSGNLQQKANSAQNANFAQKENLAQKEAANQKKLSAPNVENAQTFSVQAQQPAFFASAPQDKPVNIIEKPNYDFIEESKTIVKLTKKPVEKKKRFLSKKAAGLCLALTLGASAAICVGNFVALDQISGSFHQIEETYNFNLFKYLKNLNNLDATKKSMEFVDTYPEDLLDAGDLGQKTNWFDKFCNFIGGLFGG